MSATDRILLAHQHAWIEQIYQIKYRIFKWCKDNDVTFVGREIDHAGCQHASNKIVSTAIFDLLKPIDYYQQLNEQCQQRAQHIWLVTDNLIDPAFYRFSNITFWSRPELLGITAIPQYHNAVSAPSKLFNCFIQRVEAVRQSWFYFFYLYGLRDQGYVTFLLWQLDEYSTKRGLELFDHIHNTSGLDNLEHFRKAYLELRDQVPYSNISEDQHLEYFIRDSKYSVILETYAADDDRHCWCFTEKLMRSLQTPTINLPFVQRHGISMLKSLGLEFTDLVLPIDQQDWQMRQQSLLTILREDAILNDCQYVAQQAHHNFSLFHSWQRCYQQNDFFDDLFEEIKSK